jgi:hypothetical protein
MSRRTVELSLEPNWIPTVIDSPPRRVWLAGNEAMAETCDLAHGHLTNVG